MIVFLGVVCFCSKVAVLVDAKTIQ